MGLEHFTIWGRTVMCNIRRCIERERDRDGDRERKKRDGETEIGMEYFWESTGDMTVTEKEEKIPQKTRPDKVETVTREMYRSVLRETWGWDRAPLVHGPGHQHRWSVSHSQEQGSIHKLIKHTVVQWNGTRYKYMPTDTDMTLSGQTADWKTKQYHAKERPISVT